MVTPAYSAFEPFSGRSDLALRAVIGGPVPPPIAHDRRAAPAARPAFLPVDLQVLLELSLLAVEVPVGLILQRHAAVAEQPDAISDALIAYARALW